MAKPKSWHVYRKSRNSWKPKGGVPFFAYELFRQAGCVASRFSETISQGRRVDFIVKRFRSMIFFFRARTPSIHVRARKKKVITGDRFTITIRRKSEKMAQEPPKSIPESFTTQFLKTFSLRLFKGGRMIVFWMSKLRFWLQLHLHFGIFWPPLRKEKQYVNARIKCSRV